MKNKILRGKLGSPTLKQTSPLVYIIESKNSGPVQNLVYIIEMKNSGPVQNLENIPENKNSGPVQILL